MSIARPTSRDSYRKETITELRECMSLAVGICALQPNQNEEDVKAMTLRLYRWFKEAARDIGNSPALP